MAGTFVDDGVPDAGDQPRGPVDHELLRRRPRRAARGGLSGNRPGAAHLTPAQHEHINYYGTYSFEYGTYSFELETELRRGGRRPLRSPAA